MSSSVPSPVILHNHKSRRPPHPLPFPLWRRGAGSEEVVKSRVGRVTRTNSFCGRSRQASAGLRRAPGLGVVAIAGILTSLLVLLTAGCGAGGAKVSAAPSGESSTRPSIDTIHVISQRLNVKTQLPGELLAYEIVGIFPKVTGFVQWMGVDRGSRVKSGQLLVTLEAPELISEKVEAEAKLQSAESRIDEAQAKLTADQATYQRLQVAAQTPGVISEDELETAQKTADADRARVQALQNTLNAAKATLKSLEEIDSYLRVTAPFDGIITDRNVHPGALVGPAGGPGQVPMLRIQEMAHLRLVVDVPEVYVAGIRQGTKVDFAVPAYPGRKFSGTVARVSDRLHQATRTMPVELDVWNPEWTLDPGMFPTVLWPVRRPYPTLFVPESAVARTMENTFVIRVRDGKTEWVNVSTGITSGNLIEVFGDVHAGDQVALRASEDLQPNTQVDAHLAAVND
jgi:membrane fusion protein, multidrug efflux system